MLSLLSNTIGPPYAIYDLLVVSNAIVDVLLGLCDTLVSASTPMIHLHPLYVFVLIFLVVPQFSLVEFIGWCSDHLLHVLEVNLVVDLSGRSTRLKCRLWLLHLTLFLLQLLDGAYVWSLGLFHFRAASASAARS